MRKQLQKIILLIAVITVIGHSFLPHFHRDKTPASTNHHHEIITAGHHQHDDTNDNAKSEKKSLFSFVQLDDDFFPANEQYRSFEFPAGFIVPEFVTYQSDSYSSNTKTNFGRYIEYPPPDNHLFNLPSRAPPAFL